jgi:hypothetical protein
MNRSHVKVLRPKDSRGYTYAEVDLDLLVPDPENPRIPIQESALDTILALLEEDADGLFTLARDIVRMGGTNPAELLNVTPLNDSYLVKEGNRRIAARRVLRNPEQLRGHVSDGELDRWRQLSKEENARKLPTTALVVIGDDHDAWIDRRHLGPQSGVGVVPWKPQAKARRDARRRGVKDRTLSLLDGLKTSYPERFVPLEPPKRTFTTFERVLDSQQARAHLGIDADEQGNVVLTHGERSLRLIEEILGDLRKQGDDKLTSRRIHSTSQILGYLDEVESRVGSVPGDTPVTLSSGGGGTSPQSSSATRTQRRPPDLLKTFAVPMGQRPRKIFEELGKARRGELPNAAMILARVLLELSADHYANQNDLPFAGDHDSEMEAEVGEFRKTLGKAGIQVTKPIRDALKFAASRPVSLGKKLDTIVRHLIETKGLDRKEGNAKLRELEAADVVPLLNDAVHRLENVPSIQRVDHILEVTRPVFNALWRV